MNKSESELAVIKNIVNKVHSKNMKEQYWRMKYFGEVKKHQSPQNIVDDSQQWQKEQVNPVISGTTGLANFLGCSKVMAFSIIKEGKLLENGIQYKVGNCWKFNREKLIKYIEENPTAFAKTRSKG